jgi:hypothetical protein
LEAVARIFSNDWKLASVAPGCRSRHFFQRLETNGRGLFQPLEDFVLRDGAKNQGRSK